MLTKKCAWLVIFIALWSSQVVAEVATPSDEQRIYKLLGRMTEATKLKNWLDVAKTFDPIGLDQFRDLYIRHQSSTNSSPHSVSPRDRLPEISANPPSGVELMANTFRQVLDVELASPNISYQLVDHKIIGLTQLSQNRWLVAMETSNRLRLEKNGGARELVQSNVEGVFVVRRGNDFYLEVPPRMLNMLELRVFLAE